MNTDLAHKDHEIFWIEGLHVRRFDCQHNKLTTYEMLKYIREISLVPRRSLSLSNDREVHVRTWEPFGDIYSVTS